MVFSAPFTPWASVTSTRVTFVVRWSVSVPSGPGSTGSVTGGGGETPGVICRSVSS